MHVYLPSPDDVMEDKKALVVSGLKIVLTEPSLRVNPVWGGGEDYVSCLCILTERSVV